MRTMHTTTTTTLVTSQDEESSYFQGRQLRRHPIPWREISTVAALRLLLDEICFNRECDWSALGSYQEKADSGARAQLGKVRTKSEVLATRSVGNYQRVL